MPAYIFICNDRTEKECLERSLFGTDSKQYYDLYFKNINIGDTLFLFNYELQTLSGPFKAISKCAIGIEPEAWRGAAQRGYPYQVKVYDDSFEQRLFQPHYSSILQFPKSPPAKISDGQAQKLIEKFNVINGGAKTRDEEPSGYWIFKCSSTTGGKVFDEGLMGAPSSSFRNVVNRVQAGDKIFVWHIDKKELYGTWKARERGKYNPGRFPELPHVDLSAIVECDKDIIYKRGLAKDELNKILPFEDMPSYFLDNKNGIAISERLAELNSDSLLYDAKLNYVSGQYFTDDGHIVKSAGEAQIDNWLFRNLITHAYEYRVQVGETYVKGDFYLPEHKLVIEFWGMISNPEYQKKMREKREFYRANNIRLLELFPEDIKMLSETMKSKLAAFQVSVL